jgi:hypothetical protein
MTLTPARLLAWAERLEATVTPYDGPPNESDLLDIAREMREAAGEDARESTGVPDVGASAVVGKNLSPAEAPCEPALAPASARDVAHKLSNMFRERGQYAMAPHSAHPPPAEPELWGVWCITSGQWSSIRDDNVCRDCTERTARRLSVPGMHYEARPIPRGAPMSDPSPLPTEAGHYELTPTGWREVKR